MTADGDEDGRPLRLSGPLQGSIWALACVRLADRTPVVAAGDATGSIAWWNGATGEVLGKATTADPGTVRAMAVVPLPDGRVLFAAAGSRGTVQLWTTPAARRAERSPPRPARCGR